MYTHVIHVNSNLISFILLLQLSNEFQKLIDKVQEGSDMVTGWKKDRQDPISKKMPSKIFNFILRLLSGIKKS